jgi:hypothetical protein
MTKRYVIKYNDGSYNSGMGHPVLKYEATVYDSIEAAQAMEKSLCGVASIEELKESASIEELKESSTPRTDAIIEYLNYQFPATVGHIPIRDMIAKLEADYCEVWNDCETVRNQRDDLKKNHDQRRTAN